jgi:hypothetical protein
VRKLQQISIEFNGFQEIRPPTEYGMTGKYDSPLAYSFGSTDAISTQVPI